MFEAQSVLFLYAVSPVHAGSGTALGAIDNPVQRERHTGHPVIAGSGLKGALRHEAWADANWKGEEKDDAVFTKDDVLEIFGPETDNASDHAGALSVGDAQIVLFPVRSLRRSYVYATCPTALGRLRRMLRLAKVAQELPEAPEPSKDGQALLSSEAADNKDEKLILEAFQFEGEAHDGAKRWAAWLAEHALAPAAGDYFQKKLKEDLVILSDARFRYFAEHATSVEPHVRIDDETGTADDGGLFYTENVPPEALFAAPLMASRVRKKELSKEEKKEKDARYVLDRVRERFDGRLLQVGGDATTGRGQVLLRLVGGAASGGSQAAGEEG